MAFVVTLAGCSTVPGKLEKISVGMPEAEAVKVMGSSDNSEAGNGAKVFYYKDTNFTAIPDWYFVKFVDGQVNSYGYVRRSAAEQSAALARARNLQYQPAQQQVYQMPVNQTPARQPVNCITNFGPQAFGSTAYTNCN